MSNKKDIIFEEGKNYIYISYTESFPDHERNCYVELYKIENGNCKREFLFMGDSQREDVYRKLETSNGGELVELDDANLQKMIDMLHKQYEKEEALKRAQALAEARNNPITVDDSTFFEKMQDVEYDYRYGAIDEERYQFEKELLYTKYKVVFSEETNSSNDLQQNQVASNDAGANRLETMLSGFKKSAMATDNVQSRANAAVDVMQ